MPLEIVAIILLSFVGATALAFLVHLFLIRTRRAGAIMKAYRKVNFAHRGLHGEGRAENSLSAFRAAKEAGFGIELDVRLSKDGELVVFHDDTLTRVAGIDKRVDELTRSELACTRLSSTDDCVPSFAEVKELIDGKVPLLIEIKEDKGSTRVTETLVRELVGYKGPYIVESFNPLSLKAFRKLRPDVPIGILSQKFMKNEKYKGKALYFLLHHMLLNFLSVPDFVAYKHTDADAASLKLSRGIFGTPTFAWTVKSADDETAAIKAGFDAVIFEQYIPKEEGREKPELPIYDN